VAKKESAEKAARDIRRKVRRRFSTEEKIRIVIEGLRGEESMTKWGAHHGRHGLLGSHQRGRRTAGSDDTTGSCTSSYARSFNPRVGGSSPPRPIISAIALVRLGTGRSPGSHPGLNSRG
jgi:transposase-like protein